MNNGKILLMRHAEKPDDPLDPKLSVAGSARAQKLAQYIPETFGKPDFLFHSGVCSLSIFRKKFRPAVSVFIPWKLSAGFGARRRGDRD
jgi:hypothetical protein